MKALGRRRYLADPEHGSDHFRAVNCVVQASHVPHVRVSPPTLSAALAEAYDREHAAGFVRHHEEHGPAYARMHRASARRVLRSPRRTP